MARQPDVQYIRFYTDGSAARKVAAPAPMKTMRLPKVKKQLRLILRLDPIAIVSIVMAVVMSVLIFTGVSQLNTAREQTAAMQHYVTSLRADNEILQQTYQEGYDLEEVERMALAIGMIPKDQAQQIPIYVTQEQPEVQLSFWQRIYAFLTGSLA